MGIVMDNLSFFFWTIAYLLVVVFGVKYAGEYGVRMPPSVGAICFAWELVAVFYGEGILWGHVMWLVLDIAIILINIRNLYHYKKNIYIYILYTMFWVLFMWLMFAASQIQGMLLSSFVLDAAIAIMYLLRAKRIDHRGKVSIAVAKLCGDFPAWLGYMRDSVWVAVGGFIILLLNLLYLIYCLEEKAMMSQRKGNRK